MASLLKLKEVITEVTNANDVILYDVIWTQEEQMKILQVSILNQDGKMDIDTCAKVSGDISEKLDLLDLIEHEYYLEVCSPGAERELRSIEEIQAASGEYIYVKLKDPKAGLDEVYGYLKAVSDDHIEVEYFIKAVKKKVSIDVDNIRFIRLAVKI